MSLFGRLRRVFTRARQGEGSEGLRDLWERGEGETRTVSAASHDNVVNLWKTSDRLDDGSPGVAPVVRARLRDGESVRVLSGPVEVQGLAMYEVTNGEARGWLSELQLI